MTRTRLKTMANGRGGGGKDKG